MLWLLLLLLAGLTEVWAQHDADYDVHVPLATGLPLGINLGPDLQVLSFNKGKDGELPWISSVAGVSQGDFFTEIAGHSTHGLTPSQFADALKQAIDKATITQADQLTQQAAAVVKPVARPSGTAQAQYTKQQALLNAQANAATAAAAPADVLAGTVTLRVRPKQAVAEAAQHRALLSAPQQYSETHKRSEDSWHHMDVSIGALTVGSVNVTLANFSTAPQGCTEHAIVWAIPGTASWLIDKAINLAVHSAASMILIDSGPGVSETYAEYQHLCWHDSIVNIGLNFCPYARCGKEATYLSEVPVPQEQPAVMISTTAGAVIQKAIDSHRGRQLNGRLVVSEACLTDEQRWHKLHKLENADTAAIEVISAATAVTEAAAVEVATASTGSRGSSSTTARRLQHTHDQQQQQQQQQPAVTTQSSDSSSTVHSTATSATASAVHDSSGSITIAHDDDGMTAAGVTDQLQQREVLSGTLQVSATTDRIEYISYSGVYEGALAEPLVPVVVRDCSAASQQAIIDATTATATAATATAVMVVVDCGQAIKVAI
eukprot:6658-Heterococcus_DN1.PRE.1